jgi:hypothetical protein
MRRPLGGMAIAVIAAVVIILAWSFGVAVRLAAR